MSPVTVTCPLGCKIAPSQALLLPTNWKMEMTWFEGKMTGFTFKSKWPCIHRLTNHPQKRHLTNLKSELGVVLAMVEGPGINRYKQAYYVMCPCLPVTHTASHCPRGPPTGHTSLPWFPEITWTISLRAFEHTLPSAQNTRLLSPPAQPLLTIQVHLKYPKGHFYSPT